MKMCVGLLVIFFCQPDKQPVVTSDFCRLTPEISKLYRLTPQELAALGVERKRAIATLRRTREARCK